MPVSSLHNDDDLDMERDDLFYFFLIFFILDHFVQSGMILNSLPFSFFSFLFDVLVPSASSDVSCQCISLAGSIIHLIKFSSEIHLQGIN